MATKTVRAAAVSFAAVESFIDMVGGCDFDAAIYENTMPSAADLAAAAKSDMEAAFGPMAGSPAAPVPAGTGICSIIKQMLVTTATYHEILTAVYAAHPKASTTAKSIASIARDMRKQGHNVPKR